MPPQTINPDTICQQAVQAKLNVYTGLELFQSVLKGYNMQLDNLVNLVGLMKSRILELEGELDRQRAESQVREEVEQMA